MYDEEVEDPSEAGVADLASVRVCSSVQARQG